MTFITVGIWYYLRIFGRICSTSTYLIFFDHLISTFRRSNNKNSLQNFWKFVANTAISWCWFSIFVNKLPVYPCAQEHVYSSNDFRVHVPPCWHGFESHAFFSGISHNDAVNPMGQLHVNTGVPSLKLTVHDPPFWQRGPGPVWHGFGYWQNSPTYRDEQLRKNVMNQ